MIFELKDVESTRVEQNEWGDWDVFVVTANETRLYATCPYVHYADDVAMALRHQAIALRLLPDFLKFTEQAAKEERGNCE